MRLVDAVFMRIKELMKDRSIVIFLKGGLNITEVVE